MVNRQSSCSYMDKNKISLSCRLGHGSGAEVASSMNDFVDGLNVNHSNWLLKRNMNARKHASILRYGIAIIAFGVALSATHFLWPLIDPAATPLFFAAVMVAAFYGGLGPGLVA